MIIEDACDINWIAVKRLLRRGKRGKLKIDSVMTLTEFLRSSPVQKLTRGDKMKIVDQAILIVDQFYPHLPFKRARYAIDPVQRLRLLRANLGPDGDEMSFHSELLQAFAEMRDAHTFYQLPTPYFGSVAFLPFFLQSYVEQTDGGCVRHFIVTNVLSGFDHKYFKPGVEVTHWNGMPVARAVERLAEHIPGGNPPAKFNRGMMRMTVRSLGSTLPPDEEMTFVRYQAMPSQETGPVEERIIAVPWNVGIGVAGRLFPASVGASECQPLADLAAVRRLLWSHRLPECSPKFEHSELPRVFEFRFLPGPVVQEGTAGSRKSYGIIHIKTFNDFPEDIFNEFQRILTRMKKHAPDGLILDVRSNAGGSIQGAERLLQLLTPNEITPASFHFANTPVVQDVLARVKVFARSKRGRLTKNPILREITDWVIKDAVEAVASGSPLTAGHPITAPADANDTGQIYQGPVVLITDAGSYSATDIFSGGFQDHRIGPIIGVDENTGGGGANSAQHRQDLVEVLRQIPGVDVGLELLPYDAAMSLAIRRSARVGANAGAALEDLGVKRDIAYHLTKTDLMCASSDLIDFACNVLSKMTVYGLEIAKVKWNSNSADVTVRTKNIRRLVCCLDGHPQLGLPGSATTFTVSYDGAAKPKKLTVQGYARRSTRFITPDTREKTLELVAAAMVDVDGT